MNIMAKRLEALEAAHAAQSGEDFKVFIRETHDETDEQARERLGLTDWPGTAVFLLPGSENL